MSAIPQHHGCFTLLYADPEVREQQQYLQPLYGLTAEDDPPLTQHRRESSQDGSLDGSDSSSSNSSLTGNGATHDLLEQRRLAIPGEPAAPSHKHPRVTSGVLPAPSDERHHHHHRAERDAAEDKGKEGEGDRSSRRHADDSSAGRRGTATGAATATATAALVPVARPYRRLNRAELPLYADLCTGVVGPQPVFGGVAVAAATEAKPTAAEAAPTPTPTPYLFNSSGAPLLSSIVEADALQRLRAARQPFPAPPPRSGHILLPYPPRGSLILYGGLGDDPFNDVWEYTTATGRWARLHCTPAPDVSTALTDAAGQHSATNAAAATVSASTGVSGAAATAATSDNANEEEEEGEVVGPRLDESIADFIVRLQQRQNSAALSAEGRGDEEEDSSSGSSTDGDEVEMEEVSGVAEGADGGASETQAYRRNTNMPPNAYGQAASMYVDEHGDTCMAVVGGITVGDVCVHGLYALNLTTLTWRHLETSLKIKDLWGATAQTLTAPRRYPRSPSRRGEGGVDEEQVVVVFGGMTAMGEVIDPITHVLHLDHRLTAAEVEANEAFFLDSTQYTKLEQDRVMRRVMREEEAAAKAAGGAPMDDNQSVSIGVRCALWRAAHADQLRRWRERALRKLVGTYWTETISASNSLHGRRRPTSASFGRHFMYIFGGRDDLYFYNDLWCLNIVTRTWVQIRDGIPAHLLRRFLDEPHNPMFGVQLNERGAQLRRRTMAAVDAKIEQNASSTTNAAISTMVRNREVHHALFSSPVNSTARARTGACMVADVHRECLYLYGGFAYTGSQHLTFFDLHAYHIRENVWRRVAICHGRPWDVSLDGAQDAVTLTDACEEARPYPRHGGPSSSNSSGEPAGMRAAAAAAAARSPLPPTLMSYATQYLRACSTGSSAAAAPLPSDEGALPPPIVRRDGRNTNTNCERGARMDSSNAFRLPAFIPEARTMAAMAEDPTYPGGRFFLHGGRSGEEACGDFFELRTAVSRTVDVEYGKTQRAARQEEQTTAAAAAAAAGATAGRRGSGSPTLGSGRPSLTSTVIAAAAAAHAAPPASAAGGITTVMGSPADLNRLHLRNRRQLQRQLISAALEAKEAFEDAPAARATPPCCRSTAAAPCRLGQSLRNRAALWVRDGLAAADAKSLMFVELRNGRAVVNLRTHIHYSSGLSLLASTEQQQQRGVAEDSLGSSVSGYTAAAAFSARATSPASTLPSLPLSSPSTSGAASKLVVTQQQMDSLEGHLKRSALFLEILIYDVLLSKPTYHTASGSGNTGDGMSTTSPCAHTALLSTSPENTTHGTFPAFPLQGSSPGTSPAAGASLLTSPQVQIVSRAQYTTPRTPQPSDVPNAHTREHRTPSPALTRRSSSFCSSNGTGYTVPQPANNEYGYHILLRSLFHREPYYRTIGANEKRR